VSAAPPLRVVARPHVALHYRVLSHLDLGRDAASTYLARPEEPTPAWVPALLAAYVAAPGRLALQFAPLPLPDLPALLAALGRGALPGLGAGAADQALAAAWAAALQALAGPFLAAWGAGAPAREGALTAAREALSAPLAVLRAALWRRAGGAAPPPLTVLHVPSLGRHGRGMTVRGERVVAADLARPAAEALCQVLHEEVHAVSDREVAARAAPRDPSAAAPRDTRAGTAGHAQHLTVEAHAVAVGGDLIAAHAPAYLDAYTAWRARFGM
jgi:hypothetical protein